MRIKKRAPEVRAESGARQIARPLAFAHVFHAIGKIPQASACISKTSVN